MGGLSRGVIVSALVRAQAQLDRAAQSAAEVKVALQQVRQAVDPREVAGGFVGLTAGEAIGGAVGGVAGAMVAGPPGAIAGAEVGAFTAGMLGLKLGMDAMQDLSTQPARQRPVRVMRRKLHGRMGEIIGLTSGATVGLVVAGPPGGLVGAVVGETLGGQINKGFSGAALRRPGGKDGMTQWLDRFGKNTAGEATTVLVAGSVGSLFGVTGLKVGQRIGRVVAQRIEWDRLGTARAPAANTTATSSGPGTSSGDE